jgi:hypothetical protein
VLRSDTKPSQRKTVIGPVKVYEFWLIVPLVRLPNLSTVALKTLTNPLNTVPLLFSA